MKSKKSIPAAILSLGFLLTADLPAQKFYPDDPLVDDLAPEQTNDPNFRELSDIWDMFGNIFGEPGEGHPNDGIIPAMGVNTMGEVMNGPWFVDRHARTRMTAEELARGPGDADPPEMGEPWQVLTVKRYDVRPGLLIADSDNQIYLLRFDPPGRREMATGASMIGSRIFHALGFWVPENYLVNFDRSGLVASPEGEDINAVGEAKSLMEEDIDLFLKSVSADKQGRFRAVATRVPDGEMIGPYQFYGTRSDDPNDIYAHEHRRDLRALYVFSAWIGNNWLRPLSTVDVLVEENGVHFIRHYIVDFFSTLGSGWQEPKHPREGHEPMWDWDMSKKNFFGFGIYSPKWQRAKYPRIRSVGLFEYEVFEPDRWMANTHLTVLANALPDDKYWAAKKVMAFTDEDIRALVRTARYSDQRAEDWITKCLIERRNKIGRTYYEQVLPLESFRVENGELKFEDLAVSAGYLPSRNQAVTWSRFDNFARRHDPIDGAATFQLPEPLAEAKDGSYFAARISAGDYGKFVDVYLRKEGTGFDVVGIDRNWPGKAIGTPPGFSKEIGPSRYPDLTGRKKELFDLYTKQYDEQTGFGLEPEQYWGSLSISERTTYDAVTHALSETELTGENGESLGNALDLVASIERIAGQYYGREGDQQFRVYVRLTEKAKGIVESCQEFYRDHDNTVYHVGYPHNFRQSGKVPTLQISMADDGEKADIDVDYRSSKLPAAMWNGHLTSANSDVRADPNYDRHNNRWLGLIAWWKQLFGDLPEEEEKSKRLLMAHVPPEDLVPPEPNRPAGAHIPAIQDAAAEFLTDWLVRRNYSEALEFVGEEALACIALAERTAGKKLNWDTMRTTLQESGETVGEHRSLTSVIKTVHPWSPLLREVKHANEKHFFLTEAPTSIGDGFLCRNRAERGTRPQSPSPSSIEYGIYYATMFQVRLAEADKGVIALLWRRENGEWRIVAYDTISE